MEVDSAKQVNQSINQSINRTSNEIPINQSINQSINRARRCCPTLTWLNWENWLYLINYGSGVPKFQIMKTERSIGSTGNFGSRWAKSDNVQRFVVCWALYSHHQRAGNTPNTRHSSFDLKNLNETLFSYTYEVYFTDLLGKKRSKCPWRNLVKENP